MSITRKIKPAWKNWIPIVLLMLIAAIIRLRLTSTNDYYLLEGDGPYYPLQARSLGEKFRLALPDVPLVFIIEWLFAQVVRLFTSYSPDECILSGVRFTDAFVPPLAAIPFYLIAKELKSENSKRNFQLYLVVGFAILNFSTVLIFSKGLHKNAVAMVWVFYYFLFIIRFIKYSQRKHLYYALLILGLCALTHFGCFSILLLFSVIAWFFYVLRSNIFSELTIFKKILPVIICLLLFISILAVFDFARFKRLLFIPLTIFEAPLILFAIDGQDIAALTSMLNLIVMIVLFVIALVGLFSNRKNMSSFQKLLANIFLFFSFLMTNLLLGAEWADRMYIMAFAPIAVLCLIFFNKVQSKWLNVLQTLSLLLLICFSILMGLTEPEHTTITNEAFTEFKTINSKLNLNDNSVIIGDRNLRLLSSWFFRTKAAADYSLTKEDMKRFDSIYVIRQIKGYGFPKNYQPGIADIPINSKKVYQGTYFEIYKLLNNYQWASDKSGVPKLRGIIDSINANGITILNKFRGSRRLAKISSQTVINLSNGDSMLKKGMYVEIWGSGKPFSLAVDAEEIVGKKYLYNDEK